MGNEKGIRHNEYEGYARWSDGQGKAGESQGRRSEGSPGVSQETNEGTY